MLPVDDGRFGYCDEATSVLLLQIVEEGRRKWKGGGEGGGKGNPPPFDASLVTLSRSFYPTRSSPRRRHRCCLYTSLRGSFPLHPFTFISTDRRLIFDLTLGQNAMI